MNSVMIAMLVFVGVLAGVLAGYVMKRGGYGMRWDIILGLVGSVAGSWIFWALRISPGAGLIALAGVAFIGAAIPIVGQRMLRPDPGYGVSCRGDESKGRAEAVVLAVYSSLQKR